MQAMTTNDISAATTTLHQHFQFTLGGSQSGLFKPYDQKEGVKQLQLLIQPYSGVGLGGDVPAQQAIIRQYSNEKRQSPSSRSVSRDRITRHHHLVNLAASQQKEQPKTPSMTELPPTALKPGKHDEKSRAVSGEQVQTNSLSHQTSYVSFLKSQMAA